MVCSYLLCFNLYVYNSTQVAKVVDDKLLEQGIIIFITFGSFMNLMPIGELQFDAWLTGNQWV